MNGWFIANLVICCISLGISLQNHGKPREGKDSFFVTLFAVALQLFITYMAVKTGF